jgi:uncharacterized protein (DUF362 family)/Pyruvate/2-oxoacid:ferredoxin oxidoreductase delta subunit
VKVSITRCRSYEPQQVLDAVRHSIDLVGGIARYVRQRDRVLIKPNLLKGRPPEDAVTTHPEVLRAVIRLVREAGGNPAVGDSPGIGDLRRVCHKTGVLAVLEEEQVPLADFDGVSVVKGQGRFQRFEVARAAREADVIINLPKLKTHGMTVLTGAVKNLFGCIPGKRKVQWHFNTGVDHDAFMRMLADLSALLKPRLTVMDAVVAMEGNGPGSGDPRGLGLVLAGSDPVAVDAVAGAVVGIAPRHLPLLRAAREANAGETDLARITIVGEPLAAVSVADFRLPPREHPEWPLPEWMRRSLKEALTTRPVIGREGCAGCGICQAHCPQRAIGGSGRDLLIDYRNCIRCFCCQEFCPQGAITVGKGWVLRLVRS